MLDPCLFTVLTPEAEFFVAIVKALFLLLLLLFVLMLMAMSVALPSSSFSKSIGEDRTGSLISHRFNRLDIETRSY